MNLRTNAVTVEQDPRWRAVRARDAAANGRFYVAVKSTGIYCLPSCPSTPAKPQNVRFYATGEEALSAGFRACKRCKPDQWQPARPIEYAIGESTVGKVLAAQSDKGICALLLGDDPEALVAEVADMLGA